MRNIFLSLILLIGSSNVSGIDPYTCSGGEADKIYTKVCMDITTVIPGGSVMISEGSVENIQRLLTSIADVIVTQLDAWAVHIDEFPIDKKKLYIVGELYNECAHIIVNPKGRVRNSSDLESTEVTIGVGKKGSGGALLWKLVSQLNRKYSRAKVVYIEEDEALEELKISADEEESVIDAFIYVIKPSYDEEITEKVKISPNLELIDFDNPLLINRHVVLKRPIYHFEDIEVADGFFFGRKSITTVCVPAVLVANPERSDVIGGLLKLMINYKEYIVH